jgi:PAS domain S-box-containing protein
LKNFRFIKYALFIALPLALLAGGVTLWGYLRDIQADQNLLKSQEISKIKHQKETAYNHFSLAVNDLMQLADHVQLHELFEPGGARAKDILIKEFENVLGKTGMYYKIRVLNAAGKEVIKVENRRVQAPHTAVGQLVDQTTRDYFRASMQLNPGEVYISGFDLSAPTGVAEYPLTPVIRFGTPTLDQRKRKSGCVVINFYGDHLIKELSESFAAIPGETLIVDFRGYWIHALRPDLEWGWLQQENPGRKLQNWDAKAWQAMSHENSGQIETRQGLFTFARVYPWFGSEIYFKTSVEKLEAKAEEFGIANQEKYWTLISFVPRGTLSAMKNKRLFNTLLLTAALWIFVLLISGVAAYANLRRRTAEDALKESEKKYRYMAESNLVGVLFFDLEGKVLEANDYVLRLTGHTHEEVRAGDLFLADLIEPHGGDSPRFWDKVIAQGRMDSMEMSALQDDGTRVSVSCMAALFPETPQCILLVIDLTERHHLEDMRKRLFSTLSHELKNPITTIISYFRLLEKTHPFSEPEKEFMAIINRNANRLKILADSILEVERLEFSQPPLKMEPVNLTAVIRHVMDSVRPVAQEKGLGLSADLEPDQDVCILGQAENIEELVTNLLDNAIKYTFAGQVTVSLAPVRGNSREVELKVEDTGVGMQVENLKKIFEGFYRIPGEVQKKVSGSGLGLRIVKDIVDMYGGTIRVESVPSQGSRFIIRFPMYTE